MSHGQETNRQKSNHGKVHQLTSKTTI